MKSRLCLRKRNQGRGIFEPALGILTCLLIASLAIRVLPANGGTKDWPTKPITMIVPWAAGASTDITARTVAAKMSKILDTPISVVNKAGGSGIIGTLEAVKSSPDGYTLFVDCGGTSSIQYAWSKDLPYKVEERTYIARLIQHPYFLIVPASSPYKTLADLMNGIRSNPSSISFGLIGGTGVPDVNIAMFRAALKAKGVDDSKTRPISTKGTGEVVPAIAGGHIIYSFASLSASGPLITAGKIRPIATTGAVRDKEMPDVPTMRELGFPSVDLVYWASLGGPPGLPANVIKILDNASKETLNDPEVKGKLDKIGISTWYLAGEAHRKFVFDEGNTIKALGLQ